MTNLENYKGIVERYFGDGSATFPLLPDSTNNVIGALNSDQFKVFQAAFHKRLERLASVYGKDTGNLPHILSLVNEVSSVKNWEGAYSELVVFDFMNSQTGYLTEPISLSKTVPATETLAGALGMKNVNFDGYFEECNVCFDVKVLLDKVADIMKSVITKVMESLRLKDVMILPEYPLDLGYDVFQSNVGNLINELVGSIDVSKQTKYIKSAVIPELSYRLQWGSGSAMTTGTYNSYQHAKNHHGLLFVHAKKFSKFQPSIIVFVVFPWFSEKMVSHGVIDSAVFYRAFCRRFFCQYMESSAKAKTILNKIDDQLTIAEVTKCLSGVLFLDDGSVMAEDPNEQNVNGFAYLNPNANHKPNRLFRTILEQLGFWIDDFEHDNY